MPRLDPTGPVPVRASSIRRCLRGWTCCSNAGRPPSRGARPSADPGRSTQAAAVLDELERWSLAFSLSLSLRSASLRDGGGAARPHVWEDCFSFTNLHGFWLLLWPVVLLRFLPNCCKFAIVPWLLTNLDPEFLFNREPLVSKCLQ